VPHWSFSFGIQAEIAVLGVTFQQALAFQVTANAPGDQGFGLIEAVGCMEQRGEVVAVSGDVGVVRSEAVLDEGGPDVCRARS